MTSITAGDRIFSRRHKSGEIQVDVAGSKTLIGRIIRKDGTPGAREVVVDVADVSHIWPFLPGVAGIGA
ncbi:MAG: hypothetical protein AUJ49_04835 [Desulfovibrionaceae bacterium CG1_02_65_16]|nr:MAG: hypothetical protein AUJ49_04835 [Desulfovibrionaceae bacterium CG1_02_65_16]